MLQLVNAGIIHDEVLDPGALSDVPKTFGQTTSGGKHTLAITRLDDVVQVTVINEAGDPVDVIEVLEPEPIDVCDGSHLYIVDDMIVPPALRLRIQEVLDNVEDGCGEDIEGSDDSDSEPLAAGAGLLVGSNVTLSTENVDATFPVEARLNTLAVDSEGNVVPLNSDLEVDVETTLADIRRFQSNEVLVRH